jgi:hypothetical protein
VQNGFKGVSLEAGKPIRRLQTVELTVGLGVEKKGQVRRHF